MVKASNVAIGTRLKCEVFTFQGGKESEEEKKVRRKNIHKNNTGGHRREGGEGLVQDINASNIHTGH